MTKVTVFGQEEANKEEKKIEFVWYVNASFKKLEKSTNTPKYYDNVCLLGESVTGEFDWMMAWHNNSENEKVIYLGHWNDGVV